LVANVNTNKVYGEEMASGNLVTKVINMIAQSQAKKLALSRYAAPRRGDVLHDGMVGSGETWGGILGGTAGWLGGQAVGGLPGAIAGSAALTAGGSLAGGWGAHGAYREGQLIGDILSNPQDWTVDAAGAIVPVMPPSARRCRASARHRHDAGYERQSSFTALVGTA